MPIERLTHNIVRSEFCHIRVAPHSFFMAAHTFTFPIFLDGKNVNGFRVQELKAALISLGVPESDQAQTKAVKLFQLKSVLSSTRASQGPFGALEDGRLIDSLSIEDLKSFIVARGGDSSLPPWDGVNLRNNLPSEVQRLVRLATGCPPIPPFQVDQPRRLRSSVRAAAALAAHPGGLVPGGPAPPPFGVTGPTSFFVSSVFFFSSFALLARSLRFNTM